MNTQAQINFNKIAAAIEYIHRNFKEQPGLEEIAKAVHTSSFHFQRLFSEWAGTSPKKFLQYISVEHAKGLLKNNNASVADAAYDTGLSGTSRLHDLFTTIEGMTPAEYKNGGKNLHINFSFAESPFGNLIVAATTKGICYMAFYDEEKKAFENLRQKFPEAQFQQKLDLLQQNALFLFQNQWKEPKEIKLHLKGTDFQLKVWEALLKIPMGRVTSYGSLAAQIGQPTASRAVGTAIGSNPVAYLIPCHRVIQATGETGGYMWGPSRKRAIFGWEQSRAEMMSNKLKM
ncbi:bifunctional helix-turn-helix domain-containing protein/methylated-DNA--[protein]-cysteine S-methyltransferase [Niabella soli]|uniref:methylated-DNA--[protein]-cysteine S-methyltransferase n=1 Tax=Niabella soli DSM 19437 TaxID=929713 RepID=W0F0C4_9BACT|nr:methylated-DNA--[protein]-cysteine S-methyltransferase [Niabella soli]AHF15268.1 methylated-DNA--protein-cysteine methyltransferase [Niabella soli DSM 19437]